MAMLFPRSMSKSFGRNFQVLASNGNWAVKVFCSWDFKVSKETPVKLQSEKICTQLKVDVGYSDSFSISCTMKPTHLKHE